MMWLLAAFTAVWIAVFAYLVRLGNMQKKLENEIASLRSPRP
jgi:CcmD family protein